MNLDLVGKVALVTGSSRGIGFFIAKTLCAEGCRVALNGRNAERLAEASSALPGTLPIPGDTSDPGEARQIVAEAINAFGRLDIVICNAGNSRSVPPGEESPAEWHSSLAGNLWATTNIVEAAREALSRTGGSVVCISSICGLEVVPGAPVTYSVAKAALNAYVRGIARPLGARGVRINAVAPGNILFEGSVWSRKLANDPEAVQSMLNADVALSRLGDPKDVADLVAFLASPKAGFATGGIWTLDGGQVRS